MRTLQLISLTAAGMLFLPQMHAEIGLMPDQKAGIDLPEDERNPFAKRGPAVTATDVQDNESEESRLRGMIGALKISGYSDGPGERRALLGPFPIAVGRRLPPLIEKQTESLVTRSIEPGSIELVFEERDGKPETRFLLLRFDLRPEVRFQLAPQAAHSQQQTAGSTLGGSIRPGTKKGDPSNDSEEIQPGQ